MFSEILSGQKIAQGRDNEVQKCLSVTGDMTEKILKRLHLVMSLAQVYQSVFSFAALFTE